MKKKTRGFFSSSLLGSLPSSPFPERREAKSSLTGTRVLRALRLSTLSVSPVAYLQLWLSWRVVCVRMISQNSEPTTTNQNLVRIFELHAETDRAHDIAGIFECTLPARSPNGRREHENERDSLHGASTIKQHGRSLYSAGGVSRHPYIVNYTGGNFRPA